MAEIKIQRKRRVLWRPFLLILLIPLLWYFMRARQHRKPVERGAVTAAAGTFPAPASGNRP